MNARDQLRQIIDVQQGRLAAGVIPDREAALLALVGQIDRMPGDDRLSLAGPCLGASTTLWLGFAATGAGEAPRGAEPWAEAVLRACRQLEAARQVLRFAEAGEMRLAVDPLATFEARLAGDRVPSLWLERADIAAWAASNATGGGRMRDEEAGIGQPAAPWAHQLPYPAGGTIGALPVAACRDVVAMLRGVAASSSSREGESPVCESVGLVDSVAAELKLDPAAAAQVVSAVTLNAGNAAWHAALPRGPLPPLVRVSPDRLALCRRGLETEPLFFLARELRRRDPERYHNGARQREAAFRDDLYAGFSDRRFVTSPGRIVLRGDDRRNRTDVDAAIFDRKTGTLALFELKSQDPFARTVEELQRQRESLDRAARQVAAVLDWVNRHAADELLNRMDHATAKRFRVQRVLLFVLGRYLADAGPRGGNARVSSGSWGQVSRLLAGIGSGNPLLTLHERLNSEVRAVPVALPARIGLGDTSIAVRGGWDA